MLIMSAFAVAFAVQWKLTLITICIVSAIIIVTGACMSIEVRAEDKLMDIFSHSSRLAEEVFSSFSTVHAFWLRPAMVYRYGVLFAELERVGMRKSPSYGVVFSTEFFYVYSGYGPTFWQGIRMYARGEVDEPGDIITYASAPRLYLIFVANSLSSVVFAVIVAATALTQIAPQIITITEAAVASDELTHTIDKKSTIGSLSSVGLKPENCLRGTGFGSSRIRLSN